MNLIKHLRQQIKIGDCSPLRMKLCEMMNEWMKLEY